MQLAPPAKQNAVGCVYTRVVIPTIVEDARGRATLPVFARAAPARRAAPQRKLNAVGRVRTYQLTPATAVNATRLALRGLPVVADNASMVKAAQVAQVLVVPSEPEEAWVPVGGPRLGAEV